VVKYSSSNLFNLKPLAKVVIFIAVVSNKSTESLFIEKFIVGLSVTFVFSTVVNGISLSSELHELRIIESIMTNDKRIKNIYSQEYFSLATKFIFYKNNKLIWYLIDNN
jgi:hypothetical protein